MWNIGPNFLSRINCYLTKQSILPRTRSISYHAVHVQYIVLKEKAEKVENWKLLKVPGGKLSSLKDGNKCGDILLLQCEGFYMYSAAEEKGQRSHRCISKPLGYCDRLLFESFSTEDMI